jgi:hypothetical protein
VAILIRTELLLIARFIDKEQGIREYLDLTNSAAETSGVDSFLAHPMRPRETVAQQGPSLDVRAENGDVSQEVGGSDHLAPSTAAFRSRTPFRPAMYGLLRMATRPSRPQHEDR